MVGPAPVSHVVPSPGRPVGTDGRAWLTPLFLCSTTTACVCQALCFLFSPVSARPSHGKCVVLTALTQWRRFIVAYLHLNEWSQVKHNSCVRSRCNRRAPDVFSHIFGVFYMNCSRIIYYFIIVTLVHFLSFLAISTLLRLSFSG